MLPMLPGTDPTRRRSLLHDTVSFQELETYRGRSVRLFGKEALTHGNLRVPGSPSITDANRAYLATGIGARLVGVPREREAQLLDFISIALIIGDQPQWDGLGPHLAILRHVINGDRLPEYERLADEPPSQYEALGPTYEEVGEESLDWDPSPWRISGYTFGRPIIIPTRQSFNVHVEIDPDLPEEDWRPLTLRVQLYGIEFLKRG